MSDSKKYYKNINKIFPGHSKREKEFLNNLYCQIKEYENENDNCTYEILEEVFGTPLNVVVAYYETIDSGYLLRKANIRKLVFVTCVSLVLMAFIFVVYNAYYINKAFDEYQNNLVVQNEDTIEVIE